MKQNVIYKCLCVCVCVCVCVASVCVCVCVCAHRCMSMCTCACVHICAEPLPYFVICLKSRTISYKLERYL